MAYREELVHLQSAMAAALSGVARRGAPTALQTIWEKAAGAAAAGASRPVGFDGKTLAVEVDTPAWLHALREQEPELRARLAEALPGITQLELRLRWGAR